MTSNYLADRAKPVLALAISVLATSLALAGAGIATQDVIAPDDATAAQYSNMVVASTAVAQRKALTKLKHQWANDCTKYNLDGVRMALVGPAITRVDRPIAYKVAAMSCNKANGVRFAVMSSGSADVYYDRWKKSLKPRSLSAHTTRLRFSWLTGENAGGAISTSMRLLAEAGDHGTLFSDTADVPIALRGARMLDPPIPTWSSMAAAAVGARYPNMVVANTAGAQQDALTKLKRKWSSDCKKGRSDGVYMALVGPAITTFADPITYRVASMSCHNTKGVLFGVKASGNVDVYLAPRWRKSLRERVLYKHRVRIKFDPPDPGIAKYVTSSDVRLEALRGSGALFSDNAQIPYASALQSSLQQATPTGGGTAEAGRGASRRTGASAAAAVPVIAAWSR
jgi:hypothetical protein